MHMVKWFELTSFLFFYYFLVSINSSLIRIQPEMIQPGMNNMAGKTAGHDRLVIEYVK